MVEDCEILFIYDQIKCDKGISFNFVATSTVKSRVSREFIRRGFASLFCWIIGNYFDYFNVLLKSEFFYTSLFISSKNNISNKL